MNTRKPSWRTTEVDQESDFWWPGSGPTMKTFMLCAFAALQVADIITTNRVLA